MLVGITVSAQPIDGTDFFLTFINPKQCVLSKNLKKT